MIVNIARGEIAIWYNNLWYNTSYTNINVCPGAPGAVGEEAEIRRQLGLLELIDDKEERRTRLLIVERALLFLGVDGESFQHPEAAAAPVSPPLQPVYGAKSKAAKDWIRQHRPQLQDLSSREKRAQLVARAAGCSVSLARQALKDEEQSGGAA